MQCLKRTLGENIADASGIQFTTNAYKLWNRRFHDERYSLIGIDFTPNQLFWITQQHCDVNLKMQIYRHFTHKNYFTRILGEITRKTFMQPKERGFRVIGMFEKFTRFFQRLSMLQISLE